MNWYKYKECNTYCVKIPKILLELLLYSELFLRLPKILSYNFWGNVINVGDDVVVLDDDNTDWTEIQKKVKVIDINHYIIDLTKSVKDNEFE